MRKVLLCCVLLLCLLSSAAAVTLPYPADTFLSVQGLTAEQSALAEYLYTPIFNQEAQITLPRGTRYEDAEAAMTSLTRDYPELFHMGRNYSLSYYTNAPETATAVTPQYRMSAGEAAELRSRLYVAAYMAVAENADPLALHDRVCEAVTYGGSTEMAHTAVGALLEGRATCEGYAQAVTLLFRMAGIPCGVVTGTATDSQGRTERHAWNIAGADGLTLIDATWNDQEHLGLNTRWYYGLSTAEMTADHTPDAELTVPACVHTGFSGECHIAAEDELFSALRRFSREGYANLRFTDRQLYARAAHAAHTLLEELNQRFPADAFYGSYSITASDAQLCVILQSLNCNIK